MDEGTPELIEALRKSTELKFSVNSALTETNDLPGLRRRILRERGNICERCGAEGKHRQLYLHRQPGIELFPELKRDERSILVLCAVCLREFARTQFVFGATQSERVAGFYTTIGRVAGERLLSLFQEKSGGVTKLQRPQP